MDGARGRVVKQTERSVTITNRNPFVSVCCTCVPVFILLLLYYRRRVLLFLFILLSNCVYSYTFIVLHWVYTRKSTNTYTTYMAFWTAISNGQDGRQLRGVYTNARFGSVIKYLIRFTRSLFADYRFELCTELKRCHKMSTEQYSDKFTRHRIPFPRSIGVFKIYPFDTIL